MYELHKEDISVVHRSYRCLNRVAHGTEKFIGHVYEGAKKVQDIVC